MTDENKQDYIASLYEDGHWYIHLGVPFGDHVMSVGIVAYGNDLKDFSEALLELCVFQKEPRKVMLEIRVSEKKEQVTNEIHHNGKRTSLE